MKTTKIFEVVAGTHYEGQKAYKQGERFESTADMTTIFPGKFRCVGTVEAPKAVESGSSDGSAVESPLGEDVTSDFPDAEKAKLLVFKKGKQYSVAKAKKPTVALQEGTLKLKEVEPFIASLTEAE